MPRPKNWKKQYRAYLRSPAWAAIRERVLIRAKHCCERCGKQCRLDVHHKHYRRFGRERMSDVLAVCRSCHDVLDSERRDREAARHLRQRVIGWMKRTHGRHWRRDVPYDEAVILFYRWLNQKGLK